MPYRDPKRFSWLTLLLAQMVGMPLVAQQPASDFLVQQVTVIRPATNTRLPNQDVLIRDGRIAMIGTDLAIPESAHRISGEGRFLMPGLWDMHAHVRHPLAPELIFPQFIANGVTGLREMNADCDGPQPGVPCLEQMRQWQQEINAGQITGPRLLALSSFQVNPPWDYQVTESQIRGLVAAEHARGADLIKTYYRLGPQAFVWLVDEATKLGLPVAGHLPMRMTALEASSAGLRSLEHARDFLFDCFPGSAEFRTNSRSQDPPLDVLRQMIEEHDELQCIETFKAFVANDTWYVPTHITRRMEAMAGDSAFRDDARMRYIWSEVRESWNADADSLMARSPQPDFREALTAFYETGLEITGRAHAAGVGILLGTDSGDSYSFFGFGVHDELQELVKAGLSPAEALTAATMSAARFLGLEQDYGSVETGKVADMLLLSRDPLVDISNSTSIDAVFFNGRYYDRAALDRMLEDVASRVRIQ